MHELPPDQILLHGITFHAYHGLLEDERRDGRQFTVDLDLFRPLDVAGRTDDLHDTLDYRRLAEIAVEVGTQQRFDLIERLAAVIAERVLEICPEAAVTVRVAKHAPRLAGSPDAVRVQISRARPRPA